jgi:hypothetical protein
MTKVVVVSDTHGRSDLLEKIPKWEPDASLFVHCGDLEDDPRAYPQWIMVRGNNDYMPDSMMPLHRVISIGGHRLFITHGHRFPYYERDRFMANRAKENGCDIVCYGHTHVGETHEKSGVTLVNPGSAWMPRDRKKPSYAVIDLDGSKPKVTFKYEPDWGK